ncbi:uncharacterized protein [Nicotiana sylvestris]|uniref:uncharacterized protein n=1 Tax=Nicotiana sylvestris TaxID=4096 RepID=UPI00388C4A38
MAVETEATKYDLQFALMAQSDNDEEDENDEESMTIELGDAEQSRDDLAICVVDLNETIANLKKEKEALTEKINSVENERYDLMVVVVDLKETIENLSKEKNALKEKIANTEQKRDDFLVVITDLKETIEGLKSEHKHVSIEKGKGVVSETHIKLEKELNDVRTSLCGKLEKNNQLQAEFKKVKIDLEKSLKWTWSSDVVTAMYSNNSRNSRESGSKRRKLLTTLTESTSQFLITGFVPTMGTLDTSKKITRPRFNLYRKTKCLLKK